MEDHDEDDILSNPDIVHPRARDLMTEAFFWDIGDDCAPFGSDEGDTALHEYRAWRESNPEGSLVDCLAWIMDGRLAEYDTGLIEDVLVR